jgi:bifunctional non-homologous end joining protein LigD
MGQTLPAAVEPMLAVAGELPLGRPGWAFEMKWDGFRGLARVAGDQLRIDSRNNRPLASRYPELADLPAAVDGRRLMLDGELVVLDQAHRPSFELLQQRLNPHPTSDLVARLPVLYLAFDLLVLDDRPLLDLPYQQRQDLLRTVSLPHPRVQVPPSWPDAESQEVLDVARQRGLEGVVAKRVTSHYYPGRRSREWIKHPFRITSAIVIGGWAPGRGRRTGTLGAVLVGAHNRAGELIYLGMVGSGFTEAGLRALQDQLTELAVAEPPFATPVPRGDATGAVWVRPVLVADVAYREVTPSAVRLRHPVWRGLRPDLVADTVALP